MCLKGEKATNYYLYSEKTHVEKNEYFLCKIHKMTKYAKDVKTFKKA